MKQDDQQLRPFGTRLDQHLIDQIKMKAVQRRISLQDCSAEAFGAWLEHNEGGKT